MVNSYCNTRWPCFDMKLKKRKEKKKNGASFFVLKNYTYMSAMFRPRHIIFIIARIHSSIFLHIVWFTIFACLQVAIPIIFIKGPKITSIHSLTHPLTIAAVTVYFQYVYVVPIVSSVVIQAVGGPY